MTKKTLIEAPNKICHVYTGTRSAYVVALCGISFEPSEVNIINHDFSIITCDECANIMFGKGKRKRKPQGQDEKRMIHLLDDENHPRCGYDGNITILPESINMKIDCPICKWKCVCGGNNIIRIVTRCKDHCRIELNGKDLMEGYAPGSEMGMDSDSGGDYLIFTYCASCGQILNGNFPVQEDLFDEEAQDNIELKSKR